MPRSERLWRWRANWGFCCTGYGGGGKATRRYGITRPGAHRARLQLKGIVVESLKPTPSSGDCEVAAERTLPETGTFQFGTEMAAPDFKIENTNWHRSVQLHQECEWKQGESADGFRKDAQFFAPPVGRGSLFSVPRSKTFPIRKDKGAGSIDASRWSGVKSVGDTTKNLS